MNKKVKSFVLMIAMCGMFSSAPAITKSGDFWLGASYLASKNGASAEASAGIGFMGLLHSTLWGAAVGGGAGAAVGFGYGL